MEINTFFIQKYITEARFKTFGDAKTYNKNLLACRTYYIPLSILEVSLRNAIDSVLCRHYNSQSRDWLMNEMLFLQSMQKKLIQDARNKSKKKEITKNDLIADLNFGFWVSLFHFNNHKVMRTSILKQIFADFPNPSNISCKIIFNKLEKIRQFRNRVFHYENILKEEFVHVKTNIYYMISSINKDLCTYTKKINGDIA